MCDENTARSENRNNISRYKKREQAFFLCFEALFTDADIDEIADNAGDARDEFLSDHAIDCAKGVVDHKDVIDEKISANLKQGWKISRISKVSLALMRVAVYEMLYMDDIPVSVSINEAVELSKKYTSEEDTAFINGVLGAVAKSL
ncbi:MAG: transcription antitermination factor NusB [Ruminococcus sp.]|uniref:transcription antitermination factor NusB n=1 Tax=Ruminococcus sp. TaxID=41978 RepID=UPI0028738216|nr:transcription antitermination factor NusB [Ruminococcus sp.]MBQ3284024.1 transcription antitermination factor NusB [Ruminococcus sp.]